MSDITTNKLTKAVRKLIKPDGSKKGSELKPAGVRTSIPAVVGTASASDLEQGQGIASPLIEIGKVTEPFEIFDDINVWSVTVDVVTILNMEDANGLAVQFRFIDPNTGELPP